MAEAQQQLRAANSAKALERKAGRPTQVLLPAESPDKSQRSPNKTWGPRKTMTGQILPRSILGDPQDFENMNRQNMSSNHGSAIGSPTSPNVTASSRQRFISINSVPDVTTPPTGSRRASMDATHEMDAEAEIRLQLSTLGETKRKQRDDKLNKIKGMHIFERFEELRETHILKKHSKRQAEWEAFRQRMSKRLNKDPDDLVISRAEEYRMMLEENDLITKATPVEKRHGENVWLMSLRDAWTRYISVGGPFSGLEMPCIDRPELRPDTMYYVRQPFSKGKNKLEKMRVAGKNTMQRLRDEYQQAIEYLQPHAVEFEGLFIEGQGLEKDVQAKLEKAVQEKAEEQARLRKEEEIRQKRASRMGGFKQGSETGSQSGRLSRTPSQKALTAVTNGLEHNVWEPEVQAPSMTFEIDRLLLEETTGRLGEKTLNCMNVGSTAVYYRWTKENKLFDGVDKQDNTQRFFLSDISGAILPGETKTFCFNFKSNTPGVFSEVWTFEGRPEVEDTQHTITLKGIATTEDNSKVQLHHLEEVLDRNQRQATVDEILDDLVDHVHTPRAKGRVLTEDPDVDRQIFIARNKEAQIYYSNTTLKLFRSLADSTFELLNFPDELRNWDSSLETLKRLIYAIEDDEERERHIVQFNEIMKVAGIPPTSTSMFNSICYELVAELADSIPDIAASIRKKLDLPDKILTFKEKAQRELVYTTGPDLSIWNYDTHLLQIGGPPVEYFNQEEKEGTVRIEKTIDIEVWRTMEEEGGEEAAAEGEEGDKASDKKRGKEDESRLEWEYLIRLNDAIYDDFSNLSEKMALFNAEADLRSQVIAQVVQDLNNAAADEIRTLIREDKVDEARKIDPNSYQNIVDVDEIFRKVMKEEQEVEKQSKQMSLASEPSSVTKRLPS